MACGIVWRMFSCVVEYSILKIPDTSTIYICTFKLLTLRNVRQNERPTLTFFQLGRIRKTDKIFLARLADPVPGRQALEYAESISSGFSAPASFAARRHCLAALPIRFFPCHAVLNYKRPIKRRAQKKWLERECVCLNYSCLTPNSLRTAVICILSCASGTAANTPIRRALVLGSRSACLCVPRGFGGELQRRHATYVEPERLR